MRLFDSSIFYLNNQEDAYSKAECYREGRLVKQSIPRALALYRKAAQAGDARAMFRLGEHYQQNNQKQRAFAAFYEAGIRNDQSAIDDLQRLSTHDLEAALLLGKIYEHKKQYTQAINAYKKAHELKHPDGLYCATKLFDHMSHSERQGKEVADYYRDAIKAGSKYALNELTELSKTSGKAAFYLAHMYEHDLKQMGRALSWYEKATQLRYGEATYVLGNIYAQGRTNIAVDIAKASRNYITASQQGNTFAITSLQSLADKGNAEAQYVLGYEYYRVKNDIVNAVTWCIKAEMQGHPEAANYLSSSFTREIYWTIAENYSAADQNNIQNTTKAITFASKASELGLKEASYSLAKVYFKGKNHIEKNERKSFFYLALAAKQEHHLALQHLQRAAENGHAEAQYRLGYDYYRSIQNIEQAVFWCVKAEIQNHVEAKKYLDSTFSKEICWKISECFMLEKKYVKAIEYAIEASELGVANASEYVARVYQEGREEITVDRKKSCHYYAVAAKQGMNASLRVLQKMAEEGLADAQYCLGYEYYREINDIENTVIWCVRADIQGHKKSAEYLKTNFSADVYWIIGCQYEKDSINSETSMPKAIGFFKKAAQLRHMQASIWLAHYYQSLPEKSIENETMTFNYFLQSAKNGYEEAFLALERLGNHSDIQQRVMLSQLNSGLFYNVENSMHWNTQNQATQSKKNQLRK